MLLKRGIREDDIGVITPYIAQKRRLMASIKDVEVNTVDAFQGREKDVIIFSVAATSNLRFPSNPNRLNVALTRPRCKLVVVGNGRSIYREEGSLIRDFLEYVHNEEAMYSWVERRWVPT
jgi:superfamily I DNA and/or RNA helicase